MDSCLRARQIAHGHINIHVARLLVEEIKVGLGNIIVIKNVSSYIFSAQHVVRVAEHIVTIAPLPLGLCKLR